MQNKNTPTEGRDSAQLEAESALRGASCSPYDLCGKYSVIREDDADPWISRPHNGGDIGDLQDTADELNKWMWLSVKYKDALTEIAKYTDDTMSGWTCKAIAEEAISLENATRMHPHENQ